MTVLSEQCHLMRASFTNSFLNTCFIYHTRSIANNFIMQMRCTKGGFSAAVDKKTTELERNNLELFPV